MYLRRILSLSLTAMLAAPIAVPAAPASTLSGQVTSAQGAPLARLNLDLLNLDTGRVTVAQTDGTGAFRVSLDPGMYTVDAGRAGYRLSRGPQVVKLLAGQAATANLALANTTAVGVPMLAQAGTDAAKQISIAGEVRSPGSFPYTAGTTVRQAIAMAGGLTDSAVTDSVTITRGGRDLTVGMDDPLQPGDRVVVQRKGSKGAVIATGAAVGAGAAAAGLSTAAIVAIAAAAVGVTATAVVVANNDDASPSPSPVVTTVPPTQPPTTTLPPTTTTQPPPPPPPPRPTTTTTQPPPPQSISR